jgi:hypothetical protein
MADSRILVVLTLLILTVSLTSNAMAGENHALLIGIGEYADSGACRPLEGPPHDISALAGALQTGWKVKPAHIKTLVDREAGKSAILEAIRGLENSSRPGDFIFLYFSGHGTSSYDPKNKIVGIDPFSGALVPYDFQKGTQEEMLDRLIVGKRDLRPLLEELDKDRKILAVFDACFSGCAVRGVNNRNATMITTRNMDLGETIPYGAHTVDDSAYPYTNIVYISASSGRDWASDINTPMIQSGFETIDGKPHGALTDALLRGLAGEANTNHDEMISFNELYHYTRQKVSERFTQVPQLLYAETNSHILDQPIFNRKNIATQPNPSATGALKVKVLCPTAELKQKISRIDGIEVTDADHDMEVTCDDAEYRLFLANGYPLIAQPTGRPERVLERLSRQARIHKLIHLSPSHEDFNVFIELLGRSGVLVEGELIGFKIRPEQDSYILLIDIDPTGVINVIYPALEEEIRIHPAATDMNLPDFGQIAPAFGTDFIKVFAFKDKPAGLKSFMGLSIAPSDPLYASLLDMLEKSMSNTAQATLRVQTAARGDLIGGD